MRLCLPRVPRRRTMVRRGDDFKGPHPLLESILQIHLTVSRGRWCQFSCKICCLPLSVPRHACLLLRLGSRGQAQGFAKAVILKKRSRTLVWEDLSAQLPDDWCFEVRDPRPLEMHCLRKAMPTSNARGRAVVDLQGKASLDVPAVAPSAFKGAICAPRYWGRCLRYQLNVP